jgi:hypothetical protein
MRPAWATWLPSKRPSRLVKRALPAHQGKDSPSAGKDFVALLVTAIYLLRKMSVEF